MVFPKLSNAWRTDSYSTPVPTPALAPDSGACLPGRFRSVQVRRWQPSSDGENRQKLPMYATVFRR